MSAVTKVVRKAGQLWVPLAVLALTLAATTWPRSRETKPNGSAVRGRIVASRLTNVPSHNRLFRASLDLTSDSVWTVRVQSAAGVTVANAAVVLGAWMPEERLAQASPATATFSSDGRYRASPLSLDRPGWWNITVRIAGSGQVDSLAFNVILR
ncbi:MAG TPA: FixH family protein [Gemmatimonadaceae bacterium]|nr:FixH family protein [Gemmatimonadaceae bacterium]